MSGEAVIASVIAGGVTIFFFGAAEVLKHNWYQSVSRKRARQARQRQLTARRG